MGNCFAALVARLTNTLRPERRPLMAATSAAALEEDHELLGTVEVQLANASEMLENAIAEQTALVASIRALQQKTARNDAMALAQQAMRRADLVAVMIRVRHLQGMCIKMAASKTALRSRTANRELVKLQHAFTRSIQGRAGTASQDEVDDVDDVAELFQDTVMDLTERSDEVNSALSTVDANAHDLSSLSLDELLNLCDGPLQRPSLPALRSLTAPTPTHPATAAPAPPLPLPLPHPSIPTVAPTPPVPPPLPHSQQVRRPVPLGLVEV